jgi:hypothetical protein
VQLYWISASHTDCYARLTSLGLYVMYAQAVQSIRPIESTDWSIKLPCRRSRDFGIQKLISIVCSGPERPAWASLKPSGISFIKQEYIQGDLRCQERLVLGIVRPDTASSPFASLCQRKYVRWLTEWPTASATSPKRRMAMVEAAIEVARRDSGILRSQGALRAQKKGA